jgi:hypothetical protein
MHGLPVRNAACATRTVSSGTGGSGCWGRSDIGDLRTGEAPTLPSAYRCFRQQCLLGREQRLDRRLRQHRGEEPHRHVASEQPIPVLGEGGRVPHRVIDAEADEPAEQQVELDPLHTWAAVPADACSDTANPAAFPVSHGVPRVDDRRVLSGIIYVIRHGLQCRDARPPTLDGRKPTIFRLR